MEEQNCNGCHGDCHECHEENGCLICGKQGMAVPFETVKSLSKPLIKSQLDPYKELPFFMCVSRNCKVAYYTPSGAKIPLNQIEVPIWFKYEKEEYMVCYCRRITLEDIVEAVKHIENPNKKKIIAHLNKDQVLTDCLHQNPTGKCCNPLFDNAIKYALKQ